MKRDLWIALAGIVVVAGICFALAFLKPKSTSLMNGVSGTTAASTTETTATTSTASSTATDRVIMHVNGEPITEREFNVALAEATQEQPDSASSPQVRRNVADRVATVKILEQQGKKLGAESDPDVAARLGAMRATVYADYALRKQATAQVTDQQLRAEYEKVHNQLETVDISHILIAYKGGRVPARSGATPSEGEAMAKAKAVYAKLQSGADFAEAARAVSDDAASAAQGGSLGPLGRGQLPPDMEKIVFSLKPGQVAPPVKGPFGIHIFKAGQQHTQTFEEVKPALQQRLAQAGGRQLMEQAKAGAKIELDPSYFPPAPAAAPAAGQMPGMVPVAPNEAPGAAPSQSHP